MYKELKRTRTAIILLIKAFALWRSFFRRRRGLLKLPNDIDFFARSSPYVRVRRCAVCIVYCLRWNHKVRVEVNEACDCEVVFNEINKNFTILTWNLFSILVLIC